MIMPTLFSTFMASFIITKSSRPVAKGRPLRLAHRAVQKVKATSILLMCNTLMTVFAAHVETNIQITLDASAEV